MEKVPVKITRETWKRPAGARLRETLDTWTGRGFVAGERTATSDTELSLTSDLWRDLATRLSMSALGSEQRELAELEVGTLEALTGLARVPVHIETIGYVGGHNLRWVIHIGTARDVLSAGPPSLSVTSSSASLHVVDPITFAMLEVVHHANNATPDAERQGSHLATLSELRQWSEAPTAPPVTFSQHLEGFEIERFDKIRLEWEAAGKSFSLAAHARLPNGDEVPLPLASMAAEAPVVELASPRPAAKVHRFGLLTRDQARVVRATSTHRNRTLREAAPTMLDPSAAVPADVDPTVVDLSGYSERVLGFAPLLSARIVVEPSGIEWSELGKDGPFLRLCFDPTGQRPDARLDLTREQTEALAAKLDDGRRRSVPLVEFERRHVPVVPELQNHLANALAIANRAEREAPPDSKADAAPKIQAAIIAEEATSAELGGLAESVPWEALARLLREGCDLQPHQRDGVAWMWSHRCRALKERLPRGVTLADDMGLGKTLQVLAFLALARAVTVSAGDGYAPTLIVVPKALVENWLAEMERFFRADVFSDRLVLETAAVRRLFPTARDGGEAPALPGWVVTTYDTFARNQQALLKVLWSNVVFDEAQRLKNPDTLQTRAARGARFDIAIALSGTPIENHLADLWSLLDVVTHGQFGTRKSFHERFVTDPTSTGIAALKQTLAYVPSKTVVGSPIIRRIKPDLAERLPEKRERSRPCSMTSYQRDQEAVIMREARGRPGRMLAALQSLDQLYQHPLLLRLDRRRLAEEDFPETPALVRESPKLAGCLEILDDIARGAEKVLIFTRSIAMQRILAHVVGERFGLVGGVPVLNGESSSGPVSRRPQAVIDRFTARPGFGVLVMSPVATGVGLNIVAANHVIHYGRWWNPAKEDQATDRCYRIGQR